MAMPSGTEPPTQGKPPPLFGEPLASVLEHEGQPAESGVPRIVTSIASWLLSGNCGSLEGIFDRTDTPEDRQRLSDEAMLFRRAYRARDNAFSPSCEPFIAVLVLRYFLTKVPDALFVTDNGMPGLIEASRACSLEDRRNAFLDLAESLSKPARNTLRAMVAFFRKLLTLPGKDKPKLQSVCRFWAKALGKPKTTEQLQAVAVVLVVVIKGGLARPKRVPLPPQATTAPTQGPAATAGRPPSRSGARAEQVAGEKEIHSQLVAMRKVLNERESTIRALELERDKIASQVKKAQLESQREMDKLRAQHAAEMQAANTAMEALKARVRELEKQTKKMADTLKTSESQREETESEIQRQRNEAERLRKENEERSARDKAAAEAQSKYAQLQLVHEKLEQNFREEQRLRRKYWNEMEEMKGKIRVYCRCRPAAASEVSRGEKVAVSIPDEFTVALKTARGTSTHQYDRVFNEQATQEQVFEECKNLIQSAVDGYNVCIFAYGQTGGGKTFTLTGEGNKLGVMPRAIDMLFSIVERDKAANDFEISISILELYLENLVDLLGDPKSEVRPTLQMTGSSGVSVKGVEVKAVKNRADTDRYWQQGCNRRHTARTDMNVHSSRSHLIVTITVKTAQRQTKETTLGKLILCDLAGSERLARSGVTGDQQKEAIAINSSLTALGDVISSLEQEAKFVPYRNSPLTMLMSDSIGGSAKTLMFVCISPCDGSAEETSMSLKYASRAKSVTNKVQRNVTTPAADADGLKESTAKLIRERDASEERARKAEELAADLRRQLEQAKGTSAVAQRSVAAPAVVPQDGPVDFKSASQALSGSLMLRKAPPPSSVQEGPAVQQQSPPPADAAQAPLQAPPGKLVTAKRAVPQHRRSPSKNALQAKKDLEAKSVAQRELSDGASQHRRSVSLGGMGVIAAMGASGGQDRLKKAKQPEPEREVQSFSDDEAPTSPTPRQTNPATPSKFRLETSLQQAEIDKSVDATNTTTKLIHVKGRRFMKCRVVDLSWRSLNAGDMFILDKGSTLFLWQGSRSNRMEQAKALDVCNRIKNKERMTRANVVKLDENTEDAEFWRTLGGKHTIADETAGGEDDVAGRDIDDVLFKVEMPKEGAAEATEIGRNSGIVKEMLDTYCCYILESCNEVYVWTGTKAVPALRKAAIALAVQLLRSKKRIPNAKVVKVTEGMEPVLLKEKFFNWPDQLMIQGPQPVKSVCTRVDMNFDTSKLLELGVPPKEALPDEGGGKIKVWMCREFEKLPVKEELYGQFYNGESYIVLYNYQVKWRECYIILFWQGRTSTITDKGTSAMLTIDLDEQYKNEAKQVRVVQSQECKHWMLIFKDTYVVHSGNYNADGKPNGDVQLYHVSGAHSHGIPYPIQVAPQACALDTNDSFILQDKATQFLWHGKLSPQSTRDCADARAKAIRGTRALTAVAEGGEPGTFWDLLGGRSEYNTDKHIDLRLFHCSNSSGKFDAKEVFNYSQVDLVMDDMFILDAGDKVYAWEGSKANEEEKRKTLEVSFEYAKLLSSKRGHNVVAYTVKCFFEPPQFRSLFHGWDSSKCRWVSGMVPVPVEARLAEYSRTYSLEELQERPKHLDQTKLESYLSEEDFQKHFEMTRAEFEELGSWKKETLKRKLGLY